MSSVATPDLEHTPDVPAHQPISTTAVKKTKKKRLASDIIGQLEDKLKEDDLDIPTWLELISKIVAKDKIDQVRETYEAFLRKFPFLTSQWISYIEYELNRGEFEKVEELFKRCLIRASSVPLWNCYVHYIRRKNNLITGGEDARRIIFQAYDLAVDKVGIDPESGELWNDYLKFIEDWNPISAFDEQQKMDLKRKVYKKALIIPLNTLEQLWSDYTSFENDLNATTARKFISDVSGGYMNARSWYKEWSNLSKGLLRFESGLIDKDNQVEISQQYTKWINWINWEKSNKLEIDESHVINRIEYIFKQSVQSLIFKPELWFDFIKFYETNSPAYFSSTQIVELINESLLPNPTSFSLNFKIIEVYELESNSTLVAKKFDALIEHLTKIFTAEFEKVEELKSDLIARETEIKNQKYQNESEEASDEVKSLTDEEIQNLISKDAELQVNLKELNKTTKTITLTFCQYMKSMKRLDGSKASRQIFALGRKSKRITHHLFVENAYLEYYSGSQSTALKVFELGLKPVFFETDGEYIYKYLKFLIKINDDTNSRSLFESTVNNKHEKIDKVWLVKIFKIFLNYEAKFGPLTSLKKLEAKYLEYFPNESSFNLFADRYSFNDVESDFNIEDDLIRFNDLKETTNYRKRRLSDDDLGLNDVVEGSVKRLHTTDQSNDPSLNLNDSVQQNQNNGNDSNSADDSQFVTDEVYNLLRALPSARYFDQPLFNNSKLISLLKDLR
jgi:cleavage stimulation factor subunit 3